MPVIRISAYHRVTYRRLDTNEIVSGGQSTPTRWDAKGRFSTPEQAEEFAAAIGDLINLNPASVKRSVAGGTDELGVRRYQTVLAAADAFGCDIEWDIPLGITNAYRSRAEFEAAIGLR